MKKYKSIIFMGPPGSMKTKSGKLISAEDNRYYHLSSGETFRNLYKNYRSFDNFIMNNATSLRTPIHSNIAIEILQLVLGHQMLLSNYTPASQTIILDGIPYDKIQYNTMRDLFHIEKVILFELSREEICRRCKRRADRKFRSDDNHGMDIIEKGILQYEKNTLPLIELFNTESLFRIDANGSKDQVYQRVRKILLA
jgi:adenylate kinase family enzyme